ncbi:MAG: ISAs1 family transposase [Ktedonobacteraceae bacterium]|nr:ISAs1 family transposase [Ktedonobacteraceae bacterium]
MAATRGPIPGSEQAKHGGQTVRDRHGSDFYARIGKKGGQTVRDRYGSEFYRRIGTQGGQATKTRHGSTFYGEIDKKGGAWSRRNQELAAFFTRWEACERCGSEPSRLQTQQGTLDHRYLAIDGKTVRATSKQAHPVHLLRWYDVMTGTVLWQCNAIEKHNEISALKPFITPALVKGRIFSLYAMHTQRELCRQIEHFRGAYLLIAKDNHLTLTEDITDLFADPTPDRRRWQEAETWDKGHGRLEHRHITCSPDLNSWFAKDWSGIAQVFRLQRTTTLLRRVRSAARPSMGSALFPCVRPHHPGPWSWSAVTGIVKIASIGGEMSH